MEALKLIRKVLMLSPSDFDIAIARSLVSLANGGFEEKDRMLRVCLGTLSELGMFIFINLLLVSSILCKFLVLFEHLFLHKFLSK